MKLGDSWVSEPSPLGYRVRVALPGYLLVQIEQRVVNVTVGLDEQKKPFVTGHTSDPWRGCVQFSLFFPTTRARANAAIGHVFDFFDPALRGELDHITKWMDELPEPPEAPPAPQGGANLN